MILDVSRKAQPSQLPELTPTRYHYLLLPKIHLAGFYPWYR